MGNITIIELNHDQASEIEERPELFLEQIKRQLQSMEFNGKNIEGGKVIIGFHQSGKIHELWNKFKSSKVLKGE